MTRLRRDDADRQARTGRRWLRAGLASVVVIALGWLTVTSTFPQFDMKDQLLRIGAPQPFDPDTYEAEAGSNGYLPFCFIDCPAMTVSYKVPEALDEDPVTASLDGLMREAGYAPSTVDDRAPGEWSLEGEAGYHGGWLCEESDPDVLGYALTTCTREFIKPGERGVTVRVYVKDSGTTLDFYTAHGY